MGWLIMIGLALILIAGLWRFVRRDKAALQFLGAALLFALAGYAWQGRPAFPGQPKAPPERQKIEESAFSQDREAMLGRFDRAWYWLNLSDAYARRGDTQSAARVISSGLRDSPNDPDLWVGLGNALVVHADGMMTPAAELAFQRAGELAPNHPALGFFYGLALAQGGRIDEAERIWRALLAAAPPDAEYRRTIEARLEMIERARAMNQLPPPAAPR